MDYTSCLSIYGMYVVCERLAFSFLILVLVMPIMSIMLRIAFHVFVMTENLCS